MPSPDNMPPDYFPERYQVEYDAEQLGPEIPVECPKCGKDIGPARLGERKELLCLSCGIYYRLRGTEDAVELEATRKTVLVDDAGQFSAGQAINRPELASPTMRERVMMVVWAFVLTGLMMAGLWLVMSVWGR